MSALGTDAVSTGSRAGFVSASATTPLTCTGTVSLSAPLPPAIAAASHEILVVHALLLIREAACVNPDAASRVSFFKFIDVFVDIF